jgi:hypothetical protein
MIKLFNVGSSHVINYIIFNVVFIDVITNLTIFECWKSFLIYFYLTFHFLSIHNLFFFDRLWVIFFFNLIWIKFKLRINFQFKTCKPLAWFCLVSIILCWWSNQKSWLYSIFFLIWFIRYQATWIPVYLFNYFIMSVFYSLLYYFILWII